MLSEARPLDACNATPVLSLSQMPLRAWGTAWWARLPTQARPSALRDDGGRAASPVVQEACPNGAVQGPHFTQRLLALLAQPFGFHDHIADLGVGLQILRGDVYAAPREHFVEASQHARYVAMNMDEADSGRARR